MADPYPMDCHAYDMNHMSTSEWQIVGSSLLTVMWLFVFQFLCVVSSIFSALRYSLDAYGRAIVELPASQVADTEDLKNAWCSLNALVRSVGYATQVPITLLVVVSSAMLLLSSTSLLMYSIGQAFLIGCAGCFSTLLIVFILSNSASITTRCTRIPTLVNGLVGSNELQKMLVVQFIRNSDSGYRLWNEPVTLIYVVKVGYIIVAIMLIIFRNFVERRG
jgi:hypothetical protein